MQFELLRDTGAGNVSADADLTDPANSAAALALPWVSTPARTSKKLYVWVEAYDSDVAPLARSTATVDLVIYRRIEPHEMVHASPQGVSLGIPQHTRFVVHAVVSTPLQQLQPIDIGGVDRFSVGLQNFANAPEGVDRYLVFWRVE